MRMLPLLALLLPTLPVCAQDAIRFTDASAETYMWDIPTAWALTVEDLDGDGDMDLLMANNGSESAAFYNLGELHFWGRPLLGAPWNTEAFVPVDLNGDGLLDLLACAWGGPSALLQSTGKGRYVKINDQSGVEAIKDGRCGDAAFGDIDGDLDLYMPDGEHPDRLDVNTGGKLTDEALPRGLTPAKGGEGATIADFNDDGAPDIYVSRYSKQSALYLNTGDGAFEDYSRSSDLFGFDGQLGACAFDADGDDDLDLLVPRGRFGEACTNVLLVNQGDGEFEDRTPPDWGTLSLHTQTLCAGDIDNDGDEDILVCTTAGCCLWLNEGGLDFRLAGDDMDWSALPAAGALMVDLDDDGDLDMIVRARATDENPTTGEYVYRNELGGQGWLKVRPVDKRGSGFCHGASVRLYTAGGLGKRKDFVARRDTGTGSGWGCHGPFLAHFGVDPAATYDIQVDFADGSRGTAEGVKPGQAIHVTAQWAPSRP